MFPSTSKKNLRPGSGSPAPSVIDRLNAESEKPASAEKPGEKPDAGEEPAVEKPGAEKPGAAESEVAQDD